MPRTTYHLIPHTHWDREWYLTSAEFLPRLVAALDDVVERLGHEPGFRAFLLDGQTVLLEDYLRVRPEQSEAVAALVRSGRLQVGPWYVLADEQIPSGESLVRNLLAGAADAARLGGRLDVLYSPDAFGHPAAWPSLGAEFGITYGALWRGLGGEPGQRGDLYRWRDRVGREVRLYHLPPDGYEVGAALPPDPAQAAGGLGSGRSGAPGAVQHQACRRVRRCRPSRRASAIRRRSARARGAGARRRRADLPPGRVPSGRMGRSAGGGARPDRRAPLVVRLHLDSAGRARHPGAAQAPARGSRAPAGAVAEPLVALDRWRRGRDRRPVLDAAWRTLLRAQFHDSIGGCTSDPVARRVLARIEDAAAMAAELERASLHSLAGYDPDIARDAPGRVRPQLLLWNPAPRTRAGVVVADLTWFRQDVLVGPPGTRTPRVAPAPSTHDLSAALGGAPFQILGRRRADERLDAPRHYPDQDEVEVVRVAILAGGASQGSAWLGMPWSTRQVRCACSMPASATAGLPSGSIPAAASGFGISRAGPSCPRCSPSRSEPDVGDTYTFARGQGRLESSSRWESPVVLAAGPLVGRSRPGSGSWTAGSPRAWYSRSMPAATRCGARSSWTTGPATTVCGSAVPRPAGRSDDGRRRVRCGSAGGLALRAHVSSGNPGGHRARAPLRGGATGESGVAVFAPGFFEYEADGASVLVTLLRAVGQLSRNDLPTRAGHAGWPTAVPDAQCLGPERLQFGVTLTSPDPSPSALARIWEDLFLPPRAVWIRQSLGLEPVEGGLELRGDGLVFSALKPSVDGRGVILRCYNPGDRHAPGSSRSGLRRAPSFGSAPMSANASRRRSPPTGAKCRSPWPPGEILSLRIEPE